MDGAFKDVAGGGGVVRAREEEKERRERDAKAVFVVRFVVRYRGEKAHPCSRCRPTSTTSTRRRSTRCGSLTRCSLARLFIRRSLSMRRRNELGLRCWEFEEPRTSSEEYSKFVFRASSWWSRLADLVGAVWPRPSLQPAPSTTATAHSLRRLSRRDVHPGRGRLRRCRVPRRRSEAIHQVMGDASVWLPGSLAPLHPRRTSSDELACRNPLRRPTTTSSSPPP